MTIRLLCAVGQYPANAIVSLDAGTEAGLIAAKQATATLTGGTQYVAPTSRSGVAAERLIAHGEEHAEMEVANAAKRRARLKFSSTAGTVSAANQNKRMAMLLRGLRYTHVVPHLVNSSPLPKQYIGSVMGFSTMGDSSHFSAELAAGQKRFTVGGYDTPLVPGETAAGYGDLMCDAIEMSTQDLIGLVWQTTCLDGDGSRYFIGSGASSSDLRKGFISAKKNGGTSWVTDPTAYVGSAPSWQDDAPPVYFDFFGTDQVHRIGIFDASTGVAKENLNSLGLWHLVARYLSSSEEHVTIENYSVSGRRSADSLQSFKRALLSGLIIDTAILPICTTNDYLDADWGTPAYVERIGAQCAEAARLCRLHNINLKLRTSQITTGLAGDPYTYLKLANQRGREVALAEITAYTGRNGIIEIERRCNDTSQSVGTWWDLTETGDGLHMNEYKQLKMVPLVAEDLRFKTQPRAKFAGVLSELGIGGIPSTKNGLVMLNKTLGDSRFANAISASASAAAAAANSALTQLSEFDQFSTWSGAQYVAKFLAGDLVGVAEYAVAGSRVDPVVGRSDDVITFQLPAAINNGNPAEEIGSILVSANDRGASPINPIAETLASYRSAVEQWCGSGRRLEILIEPPQRGAYWTANAPDDWAAIVALQYELGAQFPGLVSLVDLATQFSLARGVVYALGDTKDPYYDDVHFKFRGGWLAGKIMHDNRIARGWLPANPIRSSIARWRQRLAGNKATNPTMAGSAGTGTNSGNAPTSWAHTRSASNSWDKTWCWDAASTIHAVSTAYVVGNRVVTSALPDYDYLCIAAGTTGGSAPAFSQTVLGTVVDGGVTWVTIPKCPDFYGVRSSLAYGVGTADSTRSIIQQDITIASVGLAVGDTVEASIFLAALKGFYGAQIELQAMNGASKVKSAFGLLAGYLDTSQVVPDSTVGRLANEPFVIPATTTILRIKAQCYSKNGLNQAFLFGAPELRKL